MAVIRKSWAVELFCALHPRLFRWSVGRIGGRVVGLSVLLLTTTGRRTGKPRTIALTYFPSGEDCIVMASYLGQPQHPAWYLNLQNTPEAEIQLGSRRIPVLAREATGNQRARLWNEVVSKFSDYAEYQARTERTFPVVILSPR